ncbi:MAG: M1 family peptidase, partial [Saccharothrix sp.]|nr:M1 family peptidase [Saccharothrix sp.]
MALSPKARPYLLVAALVLAVVGVLVAKLPGETGRPVAVPPTSAPPVVNEVGGDGAGDPYYPQDGNSGYDVAGYDVSISYDPTTRHLDGKAQVTAVATADLSRFNLDLHQLEVSEVTVGDAKAEFAREGDHELVITPAQPLRRDQQFVVTVTYAGEPTVVEDRALGRSGWQISSSGGAFAAGEPHSATTWFPANDTPR